MYLTGRLTLEELISLIYKSDALIAASTGPLHIAAACGRHAIGIYPPMKPMHPRRWGPIGKNATALTVEKNCSKCRKSGNCECMESIRPETIVENLEKIKKSPL